MSWLQKLLFLLLARRWAERMKAESEEWMVRCDCGLERSAWELG